jgi:putative Holliday junction resolvase
MARVLAIDYGLKRVGLAVTDPLRMFAQPLQTVPASQLIDFLADYLKKEEVTEIVLGMPVDLLSRPTDTTKPAQNLYKKLLNKFPTIKIHLIDERFTTIMARQSILEAGAGKKQRADKKIMDKVSAAIILQDFLARNPK